MVLWRVRGSELFPLPGEAREHHSVCTALCSNLTLSAFTNNLDLSQVQVTFQNLLFDSAISHQLFGHLFVCLLSLVVSSGVLPLCKSSHLLVFLVFTLL